VVPFKEPRGSELLNYNELWPLNFFNLQPP
jgi:hypothetical protein